MYCKPTLQHELVTQICLTRVLRSAIVKVQSWDLALCKTAKRKPRECVPGVFSVDVLLLLISIQPLAYVMWHYICYDGKNKAYEIVHCAHLLPAGKSQQQSHYNIPCQGSTSKLDKIYQEVRGSCATSRHAAGRIRVDQNELVLQKRVLNTICLNQGVQGSSPLRCIGSPGIRINSGLWGFFCT